MTKESSSRPSTDLIFLNARSRSRDMGKQVLLPRSIPGPTIAFQPDQQSMVTKIRHHAAVASLKAARW
jgi:hypothetical protein